MDRRDLDMDFYELTRGGDFPRIGEHGWSPKLEIWLAWDGERWQPLTKT